MSAGHGPDRVHEWSGLSVLQIKRECYAHDQYFREGMWDAHDVLRDSLLATLEGITLMIVQPEALAGRRVDPLLQFLSDNQFTPICVMPFTYTRHLGREIWRYQWNAATVEKLELADRRNCALSTAIIVLRDDHEPRELPASVRLQTLKGSAVPEERTPGSLRAVLHAPNRMINFVHTADEPADVIRELGICFERAARRQILSSLVGGLSRDGSLECERELKRLEAAAVPTDFDPQRSWQRILGCATGEVGRRLAGQRELFRETNRIEWRIFVPLCSQVGADEWDVLSIWTTAVEHQDGDRLPLIKFNDGAVAAWLTGTVVPRPAGALQHAAAESIENRDRVRHDP
jgi:hypothetical protein